MNLRESTIKRETRIHAIKGDSQSKSTFLNKKKKKSFEEKSNWSLRLKRKVVK